MEAVIFDLYETLVTEFDPNWKPAPTTAERLGIEESTFGEAWRSRQPKRLVGGYRDSPSILQEICEAAGHPADEAVIGQLYEERLAAKALPFARIDESMFSVLSSIRQAGTQIGLISNCGPEDVVAWEGCALAELFDYVAFSCEVACLKPEAEIYRLTCRGLGVTPEQALFVGDGGSDELVGAADVGMRPYWASWFIDRWPEWRRSEAVYKRASAYPRLRTLDELVAVVAKPSGLEP